MLFNFLDPSSPTWLILTSPLSVSKSPLGVAKSPLSVANSTLSVLISPLSAALSGSLLSAVSFLSSPLLSLLTSLLELFFVSTISLSFCSLSLRSSSIDGFKFDFLSVDLIEGLFITSQFRSPSLGCFFIYLYLFSSPLSLSLWD